MDLNSTQMGHIPVHLIGWEVVALLLPGAILMFGILRAERIGDQPVALPMIPDVYPADIIALLPPDVIPSIDNPQFEEASQAAGHLKPEERVIGITINGDARAYPINIPSIHTNWATWHREHPDSQVLSKEITKEQFQRRTYAEAPRSSYYVDPNEACIAAASIGQTASTNEFP